MDMEFSKAEHKSHNKRHAGRKVDKKAQKAEDASKLSARERNPKAFAINSVVKAERKFRRTKDVEAKRHHIPLIDRTPVEPPPVVVAIVGPPKVGKTTLLRCIIKNFCRQNLVNIQGPVTVVSGKKQRLTLIECNNDINSMIDVAKVADLVLLLIDASYGFEMEVFEFLNICQVHGFPRIMGVLTHLDGIKNLRHMKKVKKKLKHRFWTEVYQGAKLFYLSGMINEYYLKNEVKNLARYISIMKYRPLQWRSTHPYILVDRMEDITSPEEIRQNSKVDRKVSVYGYVRGLPLKPGMDVHIPGCSDLRISSVSHLPDPCPTPDREKKMRSLNEKERLIHAPMSGVGGIVYDKDAVYIELGGSHSHYGKQGESEKTLAPLLENSETIDKKLACSEVQMFKDSLPVTDVKELAPGPKRRRVDPPITEMEESGEEDEDDDSEDDGNEDDDEMTSGSEGEEEEFNTTVNKGSETLQFDDSCSDGDDDEYENDLSNLGGGDEDEEANEDFDTLPSNKWKTKMMEKASETYYAMQREHINVRKLVYGEVQEGQEDQEEDHSIGDLFRVVKEKSDQHKERQLHLQGMDVNRYPEELKKDWDLEETRDTIRDCFVTGKWEQSKDAENLLEMDAFGDFEDLETGEVHKGGDVEGDSENGEGVGVEEKKDEEKARLDKKRKLKEMFNAEYDGKDEDDEFYKSMKKEFEEQSKLNKSEFDGLDDELRIQYEGYRPGLYVRVELDSCPAELVTNFDASYPLILGGLLSGESSIGYIQVRFKKHRWFKKLLKNRDPLVMSLGWRRFQTLPVFSIEDHNGRHRMLKYTPQHMHCTAHFWGPITPQNTGILAIVNSPERNSEFRVSGTGTVLDLDKSVEVVKKLKLIGTPLKIFAKTAFLQGMFTSALEVAKFEGAKIKTVSGIRGIIKRALSTPAGACRATFEDKILMSDIVFMRTWFKVDIPKLYNVVTSLLLAPTEKMKWQGMKTVAQLKRESDIKNNPNPDSLYTPVERVNKELPRLVVPRDLQKNLPYLDKPKYSALKKDKVKNKVKRIAVVKDPKDKEVSNYMKMLRTVYNDKVKKDHLEAVRRVRTHIKQSKSKEKDKIRRQKELRKKVFKIVGRMESKS